MQEQLMAWHFNCQAEWPSVDEPHVSVEVSVSPAKALRSLEHFWGQEYTAWTCSTQGKLEFPPRPWQCDCQPEFFVAGAKAGEGKVVLQLRDRDCVVTAFDVLFGRQFAVAVLAIVARHNAEKPSAQ